MFENLKRYKIIDPKTKQTLMKILKLGFQLNG